MLGSSVLLAVPITPLDLIVMGFMLGCASFGVYAALEVGRPLAGPVPEPTTPQTPMRNRAAAALRGLLRTTLLVVGVAAALFILYLLDWAGPLAPLEQLLFLALIAVAAVVPYFCFMLVCSPLFGRLENQRAAAIANGRSLTSLRWEAALAVLLVIGAFVVGVRIGLALIGRS